MKVLTLKSVNQLLHSILLQPFCYVAIVLSAKIFQSVLHGARVRSRKFSPGPPAVWCQMPHVPRFGVKCPTPTAVRKVKFPTPGIGEGVKCPEYARGVGGGGMLTVQIDRRIMAAKRTGKGIVGKKYPHFLSM